MCETFNENNCVRVNVDTHTQTEKENEQNKGINME